MNDYIMNEYSFEYNVFDESGADISSSVRFFPERQYEADGPLLRLAVLIEQWNLFYMKNPHADTANGDGAQFDDCPLARYQSAAIRHFSGAVDFTDIKNETTAECSVKKYNMDGGKWTLPISPERFSGTGKIMFPNGYAPERTFYYTVSMFKKFRLNYTYKIRDNNTVSFKFDTAPKTDVRLKLMESKRSSPCLRDDNSGEQPVVLKKGSTSADFKVVSTAGKKYRVTFADSDDGLFYLLCDNTVYCKNIRMSDEKKRELRCPFCLRPIVTTPASKKLQRHGKHVTCVGEEQQSVSASGMGRVRCFANSRSLSHAADTSVHKKLRQFISLHNAASTIKITNEDKKILSDVLLPPNYETGKSIILTVIGNSNAGKSVFISRLAGIASDDIGAAQSVLGSPTYLSSALHGSFNHAEFYTPETFDEKQNRYTSDGWRKCFQEIDSDIEERGIMVDYAMPLYGEIAKRTSEHHLEALQRMPFIIRLDNYSNMTLFDVPGEHLRVANAQAGAVPSITFSDGLILLVNVSTSAARRDSQTSNDNNIKEAGEMLDYIIQEIARERGIETDDDPRDDITDRAIAVVVCKFDLFDDLFDENSAVLSSEFDESKGKYAGSELQRNTDVASEEVKQLIAASPNSDNLIKQVERFKYRKYFAVSALGRPDCVQNVGGASKLLYAASPKRMEHVIKWLLWQSGIIE